MSDIPSPKKLRVGFSFDKDNTHTFAFGWEIDSVRKTIRYVLECSTDKKNFHAIPAGICRFADGDKRIDVPFSDFCKFLNDLNPPTDIRNHRYLYWRLTAEFHDSSGEKIFCRSTSNVAVFEMPPLV